MPEIPKDSNAPGYFIGADNRGNPQSGALIGEDGTETPSVAIVWPEATDAKEPAEDVPQPQEATEQPAMGPQSIDIHSTWIFDVLLRNLPFHAFVSENLPEGKAWHFPSADAYMVNQKDWQGSCLAAAEYLTELAYADKLIDNRLPNPYEDPQVGPVLAMSATNFMTVRKKNDSEGEENENAT